MKYPIGEQRLAYVFNFDMPSRTAGSIHAAKMCQSLAQEGYSPTLFAFRPLHLENPKSTFYHHYGIQDVFDIELIRSRKLLRGHDFAFRAAYTIKKQKFPAVFSRGLLTAMWTAIWGVSTIYETHQPPGKRLGQYYQRVLFSRKAFQRLIVISDVLKTHYLEYYSTLLSPEQIIVEPDAVDLERFESLPDAHSARLKLHLPEDVFTVGYSGHLYEGRGIDLILELAKRLPTINFILMGGEETHIENWRHVIQNRELKNVTLMGFVPNAELPLYLAACDVLLMPYQHNIQVHGSAISTHEWMSPMKMFEYMAAKRLIVSSDFPILKTVLHHEQNAVFCPPNAVDDWEKAIRKAMENPLWAQKLADQARYDVENYTWRKRVQRIMSQVE